MGAATFETDKVDAIIAKYDGDESNLILMMQDIQAEYRYLPPEALAHLGQRLNVAMSRIYHVATFYRAFSLEPKGKHQFHVCMGTACHVRGSTLILDTLERELGVKAGQTSADRKYSMETVNCLGSCALGPLVVVDEEYIGHATSQKMRKVVDNLKKKEKEG
jgi:NADH-quinone oxidoreductase subunit E